MAKRVVDSYVTSTDRIQPHQANNYGNAHGGIVMYLMDELGAIAAMLVGEETCVTAHIGSVDFHSPIPVGNVAHLEAFAYDTGRTSIRVYVAVESRDPRSTERTLTTSATFTFVAVDESGSPAPVPALEAATERGERLVARATGTGSGDREDEPGFDP